MGRGRKGKDWRPCEVVELASGAVREAGLEMAEGEACVSFSSHVILLGLCHQLHC